jgi:DNA invertase Pin-like site-specific DNA recombinase
MSHLLGDARVSTSDQHPDLQVDALTAAGCYRVFVDRASGARADRQVAEGAAEPIQLPDHQGVAGAELVDTVTGLADQGVGFRSLQEQVDATTPGGKLVFHVFAALAEFERDLVRERTTAGLAAARGRTGGRPGVMTADKLAVARQLYAAGEHTVAAIAATLGVSRASIYRHLQPANIDRGVGNSGGHLR